MLASIFMQQYDPEALGAQCSKCFLRTCREGGPVPPEINPSSSVMVSAEAPGGDEVEHNRPLIGKSGQEAMRGLAAMGITRAHASWNNSILCRPPGNDLDRLLLRLKRANKDRIERGLEPYLSPMEACRPRFIRELRLNQDHITMGKIVTQAITSSNRSIMDMRGMPLDGVLDQHGKFHTALYTANPGEAPPMRLRVVPTVHPAFVLRAQRWRKPFRIDIARAIRWFTGTLQWREPQYIIQPSPEQLEYFLLKCRFPFWVYDLETDAKECLTAKIRCIGFGTPEYAMVVPLLGIDGHTRFYAPDQEEEILEIVRRFFLDPTRLKAGHNIGYYDRIVCEQQLGYVPYPIIDTILLHRGVESELPHNLGFVGSIYTDVMDAWKADHTATQAKSDFELHYYNITDCVVDARLVEPLGQQVHQRGVSTAVTYHHDIQAFCAGLHTNGMFVDQHRRKLHDARLQKEAAYHRLVMRQIVGSDDFNPASRDQVAEVLFDRWGLTPDVVYASHPSAGKKLKHAYTKSGAPSTGDDHLRAMLIYVTRQDQKTFVESMRKFRHAVKIRGTNVIPLRPYSEPYYEVDDLAINLDDEDDRRAIDDESKDPDADSTDGKGPTRQRSKKLKEKRAGWVLADHRVHPHYNGHAATSQRLTSSEPNGQNWERKIRDMIVAQCSGDWSWHTDVINGETVSWLRPNVWDRALIGADEDQLELRFASALAGASRYLEVFARGGDPHEITCIMLYGSDYINGSAEDKKRLRDFAKRFVYAVIYRATTETIHETLASSENEAGELVFPWLTLKQTRIYHDKWLKASPEFESWWERDLTEYRLNGCLIEPVLGWRRDFLDGEDENGIANFKCQSGGAALVHLGTIDWLRNYPFHRWGPGTGAIQQGHDALLAEVLATHGPTSFKLDEYRKLKRDRFGAPIVDKWCPRGCKCVTAQAAGDLRDSLTIDGRKFGLPVNFTASPKAAFRWIEV